jgi:hypothetical protein
LRRDEPWLREFYPKLDRGMSMNNAAQRIHNSLRESSGMSGIAPAKEAIRKRLIRFRKRYPDTETLKEALGI